MKLILLPNLLLRLPMSVIATTRLGKSPSPPLFLKSNQLPTCWSSLGAQQAKDQELSLQWLASLLRCSANPWAQGTSTCDGCRKKKRKKKEKTFFYFCPFTTSPMGLLQSTATVTWPTQALSLPWIIQTALIGISLPPVLASPCLDCQLNEGKKCV